jgi:hypothetical protein
MGKARREAKLAKRTDGSNSSRNSNTGSSVRPAFSWKETLGRMAKVAPRVLLMTLLLVGLQAGASLLKIPFLSTPLGQLVMFGVVYFVMFRWIYADVLPNNKLTNNKR